MGQQMRQREADGETQTLIHGTGGQRTTMQWGCACVTLAKMTLHRYSCSNTYKQNRCQVRDGVGVCFTLLAMTGTQKWRTIHECEQNKKLTITNITLKKIKTSRRSTCFEQVCKT
jgi:hypothetical protein